MFILCIGCVLQLILVKAEEPSASNFVELKSQEILLQVNEMLAEVDDKIGKERKFLSQLDENGQLPPNATNTNISDDFSKLTSDTKAANIVREWLKHHPKMPINETPMSQTTRKPYHPPLINRQGVTAVTVVNVSPSTVDMPIPQDPILDISLDADPEEIPELPPGWPFNEETSTEPTTTSTGTTLPPKLTRKEEMRIYKDTLKVGYVYAGMIGLNDMLVEKDDKDLMELIKNLGKKLVKMADDGELNILSDHLAKRVKILMVFQSFVGIDSVKEFAREVQRDFLVVEAFPKDLGEIFSAIDAMIEPVDGEALFDVIDEMDRYSLDEHGTKTAENLSQKFIEASLKPLKKKKDTIELKNVIAKANRAYNLRYPDFRRSEIFNVLEHFIVVETERSPNVRRRISKGTRHIKAKYKKIIRHLIKKHPTLLKYFAKHYQHNVKHKHHHSRKKHHTSHYEKHDSSIKQKHERRKSVGGKMNSITHRTFEAITPEKFSEANLEIPNFRERADQTTFMYPNRTQKRYSIVTEKTGGSKRISPSVLTRRFNVYNKSHHVKSNVIKDGPNRLEFSSTKTVQNNKVLKKIVGDSSYSDEEKYLRTMLYDAFFHGNDTITSNWTGRARVHHLGAEGSDTDEEWIFKSNIYKVFQQPII